MMVSESLGETVPANMLVEGKPQKISLKMDGRGEFSFSAVLGGFVPADSLKSTTEDWQVTRFREPARRMLDGKVVPRGLGVLTGSYEWFRNPLTQLPVGERAGGSHASGSSQWGERHEGRAA